MSILVISLLLSVADWRTVVTQLLERQYALRGAALHITPELLRGIVNAAKMEPEARLISASKDPVHGGMILKIDDGHAHPLLITTTQSLPELLPRPAVVAASEHAPVLKAGSLCEIRSSIPGVEMQLTGVALNAAAVGDTTRVRISDFKDHVVRVRVTGEATAEVIP